MNEPIYTPVVSVIQMRAAAAHILCNFDRPAAEFLRAAKIAIEKVVATRLDTTIDGWQISHRRTAAMNPVGQVFEIDAV